MAIKNNYFSKFDGSSNRELDFMETGNKGNIRDILNIDLQLQAYGIVSGNKGEYTVMQFTRDPENFYFGGNVITDKVKEIDKDGMHDALKDETIRLVEKISKYGNSYIDFKIG